jgi:AraC family transcriptional regulator
MTTSQMKRDETLSGQLKQPRFENCKPMLIAGLFGHSTAANWEGIPAQWQHFGLRLREIPGQVGGATYGLCFLKPDGLGYLSGVEVSSSSGLPSEFTSVNIPAQRYAVFAHREQVSKLHDTCQMASQWLHASGYQVAKTAGGPDFFERYGENFDQQTGMGDIEVWIPLSQPKS